MGEKKITTFIRTTTLVTGHFREKAGYYAWRPAGTENWLLIYTISGKGRFGYQGGEHVAQAGELTLLRPGTLHDYGVESELQRWELLWAHFVPRPQWIDLLQWPQIAPGLMHLNISQGAAGGTIVDRFLDAHNYATGAHRRRDMFAMNALEEMFLRCDLLNPLSDQARLDPRIREAMERCCRSLQERITVESLAETAGLSVSRFAHLFRGQTGTTPQQFVEHQRIERAKQLLELSALSIKEIAGTVGFESQFYFSLRFKRSEGISPTEYRTRRTAMRG